MPDGRGNALPAETSKLRVRWTCGVMSALTFELGVMARGLAGNADEADDHSEVKLLRSAMRRIEELESVMADIASGELGVNLCIKYAKKSMDSAGSGGSEHG